MGNPTRSETKTVMRQIGNLIRALPEMTQVAIATGTFSLRSAVEIELILNHIRAITGGEESTKLRDWIIEQSRITDYSAEAIARAVFYRVCMGEPLDALLGDTDE